MSEVRKKTPEEIEAQLAAFASEKLKGEDLEFFLSQLGTIALANADQGPIKRIVEKTRYAIDNDTLELSEVHMTTEKIVADSSQFKEYLHDVGGRSHEGIQGRKDMFEAYREFEPGVDELIRHLDDLSEHSTSPKYINAGSNSRTFFLEKDGQTYVVRIPRKEMGSFKHSLIDSHIKGAIVGRGIPHLEHIVAASHETGVTVAELLPGKGIDETTAVDIEKVTEKQVQTLVDTLIIANHRGIEFDLKSSNILYDSREGFSLLDYDLVRGNISEEDRLENLFFEIADTLTTMGYDGVTINDPHRAEVLEKTLSILSYLEHAIENRFDGEKREFLLKRIKGIATEKVRGEEISPDVRQVNYEGYDFGD